MLMEKSFPQIGPKLLFSVNAVVYNGKTHDHLEKVNGVLKVSFLSYLVSSPRSPDSMNNVTNLPLSDRRIGSSLAQMIHLTLSMQNLDSVEHAVILPFVNEKFDLSKVTKACSFDDFLAFGSTLEDPPNLQFEQVFPRFCLNMTVL